MENGLKIDLEKLRLFVLKDGNRMVGVLEKVENDMLLLKTVVLFDNDDKVTCSYEAFYLDRNSIEKYSRFVDFKLLKDYLLEVYMNEYGKVYFYIGEKFIGIELGVEEFLEYYRDYFVEKSSNYGIKTESIIAIRNIFKEIIVGKVVYESDNFYRFEDVFLINDKNKLEALTKGLVSNKIVDISKSAIVEVYDELSLELMNEYLVCTGDENVL